MARSDKSRIENSNYCVAVILTMQVSVAFLLGLNLSALNSSAPAIKVFINDSYTDRYDEPPSDDLATLILTLAHSMLVWGSLAGALMVKPVLHNFSRKGALCVLHVINSLSVILMSPVAKLGKSFESLIIGRFVAGIARGIGFSSIMVVVAELSCRRRLGLCQSPTAAFVFVAATLGAGLGHKSALGTPDLWMWITCMPALSSLAFFLCWPWLPETPVLLLRQGKREEALRVLKILRIDPDVDKEIEVMQKEINEEMNTQAMPLMTILRDPRLRMQFLTALVTMNTSQLTGIQAILLYSDFILLQAGVGADYVTFITMGIFMQAVVAFLIFVPLEKKIGTKRVLVVGMCIIACSYVLFTVANALHKTIPWMSYLALAAMCTALFGVQLGPQLTMLSLPAELTTATSLPTVAFYSGCTFWTIGGTIGLVFPYSVSAWNAYAYIPFVVLSLALIPFTIFFVPETRGRSAVQIQRSFRKKSMQSLTAIFTVHGNAPRTTVSPSGNDNYTLEGDNKTQTDETIEQPHLSGL